MKPNEMNGGLPPRTVRGPAFVPRMKEPPRVSAPGLLSVALAPARHMPSLLKLPQFGHIVERGTQSATHSSRFPTMSKAPRAERHALREPVSDTPSGLAVLQSVVPLSGPGSGVPFAPTCHSALVGSRLPALAQASCAWNQVMNAEGSTDGRLTA